MNVLFFQPSNDYTGSTKVLANIIERDYNGVATVITNDSDGGGFLSDMQLDLKVAKYPYFFGKKKSYLGGILNRFWSVFYTLKIAKHYEIFYINTIKPFYAAIIGVLLKKKIVYHVHEKFIERDFAILVAEWVFNHVQSERIFVSNYLSSQYPISNYNTKIAYNFLSKSFINKVIYKPTSERDLRNIIMICSLAERKGVYNYIKLSKLMPDKNFMLILSCTQTEIDSKIVDKPANLKVLPAQKNIHPWLGISDLLLNLSIPNLFVETFGMTIIEAKIYGIPAIVPNVGGPIELINNGIDGYSCDVTDIELVKSKINFILDDKQYEQFSNAALKSSKKFL